jgi:hypothetical protein
VIEAGETPKNLGFTELQGREKIQEKASAEPQNGEPKFVPLYNN